MCVALVAIGVFFNVIIQSAISGMREGIERVVQVFETGHASIVSAEYEARKEIMPVQYPVAGGMGEEKLTDAAEAIPGAKAVLPRITAFATLQESPVKHAQLWGIRADKETAVNSFSMTGKSDGLAKGSLPAPSSNECAVGVRMAEKMGIEIGDRIPLKTVSAQFSDKLWSPTVTGIYEFDYPKFDEEAIIVDYERLQRLLVMDGAVQQLAIFAENPSQSAGISAASSLRFKGDVVWDWRDNSVVAMARQIATIIHVIGLAFLIMAIFPATNTVMAIVHERFKEIGMMRDMGMARGEIVQAFFFEALFLSIAGSLAGTALGAIFIGAGSACPLDLNAITGAVFKELPIPGHLFLGLSPGALAISFCFGVVFPAICSLISLLMLFSKNPAHAQLDQFVNDSLGSRPGS
jgi:ABC-type lipoprotein release transport system permease subunit